MHYHNDAHIFPASFLFVDFDYTQLMHECKVQGANRVHRPRSNQYMNPKPNTLVLKQTHLSDCYQIATVHSGIETMLACAGDRLVIVRIDTFKRKALASP